MRWVGDVQEGDMASRVHPVGMGGNRAGQRWRTRDRRGIEEMGSADFMGTRSSLDVWLGVVAAAGSGMDT